MDLRGMAVMPGDALAERDQLEVLGGGQRRVVLRVEAAVLVPLAAGLQGRDGPGHRVAVGQRLVAVQHVGPRHAGGLAERGVLGAGHRATSDLAASAR